MTSPAKLPAEFDPHAPLVDPQTGIEYEDFAAYLQGKPVACARTREIVRVLEAKAQLQSWRWAVYIRYRYYNRQNDPYANQADHKIRRPQGWEAFGAGGPPGGQLEAADFDYLHPG